MKKIVVTGSSGKAGRAAMDELANHGYSVLGVDWESASESPHESRRTDLTDFGQTLDVLHGADAVVHMAAIANDRIAPESETFRINAISTYNVFSAAAKLGLKRVVWASSETCLGLPFKRETPIYAPLDESQPLYPESVYSLSKTVGEEMARQFHRWSGIPFLGLRFSNIMLPDDYARFEAWQEDPSLRQWNLWGYVDARDVGQSCRVALEAEFDGADYFIIAAADTVMRASNQELMAKTFPNVPLKEGTGPNETLLSIEKARSVLGYDPKYTWKDQI